MKRTTVYVHLAGGHNPGRSYVKDGIQHHMTELGNLLYLAEAIEDDGRYYYKVEDTAIGITKAEYDFLLAATGQRVICCYFTLACKLDKRIKQQKKANALTE